MVHMMENSIISMKRLDFIIYQQDQYISVLIKMNIEFILMMM